MSVILMRELRKKTAMTQAEMASVMGLGFRCYQELEAGRASFARRHTALLERASLKMAVDKGDINLTLPSILNEVRQLSLALSS